MYRLAVALLAVLSAVPMDGASAADLPGKAPVYNAPAAVPPTWAGFYIGINAGGVWSDTNFTWDPNPAGFGAGTELLREATSGHVKTSGFIGGGQIGHNIQFDRLVVGIEGDLQYTDLSDTRNGAVFIPPALGGPTVDSFTRSMESKWLATLRGRLGVAFGSWLPYATGGLAVGRVSYSDFGFFPFLPSTNAASSGATRAGWTLGGGVEWKIAPRWSIKAEYLYVDLGATAYTSLNSVVGALASSGHTHHLTENIARIGLNYSFGQPAAH